MKASYDHMVNIIHSQYNTLDSKLSALYTERNHASRTVGELTKYKRWLEGQINAIRASKGDFAA